LAALSILTLPGNKEKLMYLLSADKIRLIKKVTPGDRFYMNTKILNHKRGIIEYSAEGIVIDQIVSKAEFRII